MAPRIAWLGALAGLQLVALTLAHDLTFLSRYGSRFNEALVHSGHGTTWAAAVGASALLALALAGLAAARLAYLGLRLRRHDAFPRRLGAAPPSSAPSLRSLAAGWARIGLPMAALTVGLLTLQENVERASIGAAIPGPMILLSPEYAGGLWIALGVGLLVGLVAALFRWRLGVLLARLRAARFPIPRATRSSTARPGSDVLEPRGSVLGRRSALRAPPAAVAP